ncbi:MAG: nitrogenase component 1, partial [Methanoregulaceae archaeon]|nr:nitrogenase component 1 [Methanoregulaceae archaeon]
AGIGIEPALVVIDTDSGNVDRIRELAGERCLILVSPEQNEIREALADCRIDLLVGGMMELPLCTGMGIRHMDMMHGSQKTVGEAGTRNLLSVLAEK